MPPKRWVVERPFARLGLFKRLSKDVEMLAATAENMIRLAMSNKTLGYSGILGVKFFKTVSRDSVVHPGLQPRLSRLRLQGWQLGSFGPKRFFGIRQGEAGIGSRRDCTRPLAGERWLARWKTQMSGEIRCDRHQTLRLQATRSIPMRTLTPRRFARERPAMAGGSV